MSSEFTLPCLPPSANRIWRRSGKHIHKATAYTNWLTASAMFVKAQRPMPIVGRYKLSITASRPDKRRRDLDNLIKPISDLLVTLGVIEDDSHAEMISMRWVTTGPALQIRVSRAGVE